MWIKIISVMFCFRRIENYYTFMYINANINKKKKIKNIQISIIV